jgi:serralysin
MNNIFSKAEIDFRADAGAGTRHDLQLGLDHAAVAAAEGPGHEEGGVGIPYRSNVGNTTAIGTEGNFTNQDVNGILSGFAWNTANITFSFPTAASNYGPSYSPWNEPNTFVEMIDTQKDVARYAFSLLESYTQLNFTEIDETDSTHAVIRLAGSNAPSTSWAAYPSNQKYAGDVWVGNIKADPALKAGYAFDTILHELGHSLGLKHGQQDDGAHGVLPDDHNSTEWSLMSYHSYIGADNYYRNADGSGNQSYMINDIAALQYMYGANYTSNAGDTTYAFNRSTGEMYIDGVGQGASETNTIYQAIWDGNGVDTYDLHNYNTKLVIDLRPGEWSTFSDVQLADLNSSDPGVHFAHGNIANAHMFEGDPRSLIENAYGGGSKDIITGNIARNLLTGGAGKDSLYGMEGKDTLVGGAGKDRLEGGDGDDRLDGGSISDKMSGGGGADTLIGGGGADKMGGGAGADVYVFGVLTDLAGDRIFDLDDAEDVVDLALIDANTKKDGDQAFTLVGEFHNKAGEMMLARDGGKTLLLLDTDGNGVANAVLSMDGDHMAFDNFVY